MPASHPRRHHALVMALGVSFVASVSPAMAQDVEVCFSSADLAKSGSGLSDADKKKAHDACMRALAETSNVVQKYHLQEADFDIMGRPSQK